MTYLYYVKARSKTEGNPWNYSRVWKKFKSIHISYTDFCRWLITYCYYPLETYIYVCKNECFLFTLAKQVKLSFTVHSKENISFKRWDTLFFLLSFLPFLSMFSYATHAHSGYPRTKLLPCCHINRYQLPSYKYSAVITSFH